MIYTLHEMQHAASAPLRLLAETSQQLFTNPFSPLAYLPHSSEVFPVLAEELAGHTWTKGSLHFAVDEPLPDALVAQLIAVRRSQAGV